MKLARLTLLTVLVAGCALPLVAQRGPGNQQGARHLDQTLYLTGRVVTPQGEPPPSLAMIVRVCRGQEFPEGYAEPNGNFNVRVGFNAALAMEDPEYRGVDSRGRASGDTLSVGGISGDSERFSTMKNRGTIDLTGCDLRVKLDGYRADPVTLGRRNVFDNPDLGTIVIRPLANVPGSTVSATSLTAPKQASKLYEKAQKTLGQPNGKEERAIRDLEKAVEIYPQYAAAWSLLGSARMRLGDEQASASAYRQAVEADPDFLAPYPPLIRLALQQGRWGDADELCEKYLKLNPNAQDERFFHALALLELQRLDDCEQALGVLLQDPATADTMPQARHLKGVILAQRGDFAGAANHFNAYLDISPEGPAAGSVRKQLAEWEALGVLR